MRSAVARLVGTGLVLALFACTDGAGGLDAGVGGDAHEGGVPGKSGGGAAGTHGTGSDGADAGTTDGGTAAGHGGATAGGASGDGSGGNGGDDDDDSDDPIDGGTEPVECTELPCPAPFELLFAREQLPSFYLTIPDGDGVTIPDSWTQLEACDAFDVQQDPPLPQCEYQPATFHAEYDPDPLDAVTETFVSPEVEIGIRLKGRASYNPIGEKPGLKIKFASGQRFLGLSKLTLNNVRQDPSGIRERMAYRIYRDAGLDAPLANNARVYVKRGEAASYEYYGLYANVQTLDRRFIEYRFGEVAGEAGNLFDTKNDRYFTDFDRSSLRDQGGTVPGAQEQRFELETNESMPDLSDLTAAIDGVYVEDIEAGAGTLLASASPVIDVDQWLRVVAAQALLADWDGFAGARNNYKAYHDLVRDRFVILPWGTDQTFGLSFDGYRANWQYGAHHESSERATALFLTRCLRDAADCGARYEEIMTEVLASFDVTALLEEADYAAQQIDGAMHDDTRRFFTDLDFHNSVQHVRHFIEHRLACVDQLRASQPCEVLTCPVGYEQGCH
jgi:spore coat protein CotH